MPHPHPHPRSTKENLGDENKTIIYLRNNNITRFSFLKKEQPSFIFVCHWCWEHLLTSYERNKNYRKEICQLLQMNFKLIAQFFVLLLSSTQALCHRACFSSGQYNVHLNISVYLKDKSLLSLPFSSDENRWYWVTGRQSDLRHGTHLEWNVNTRVVPMLAWSYQGVTISSSVYFGNEKYF